MVSSSSYNRKSPQLGRNEGSSPAPPAEPHAPSLHTRYWSPPITKPPIESRQFSPAHSRATATMPIQQENLSEDLIWEVVRTCLYLPPPSTRLKVRTGDMLMLDVYWYRPPQRLPRQALPGRRRAVLPRPPQPRQQALPQARRVCQCEGDWH